MFDQHGGSLPQLDAHTCAHAHIQTGRTRSYRGGVSTDSPTCVTAAVREGSMLPWTALRERAFVV